MAQVPSLTTDDVVTREELALLRSSVERLRLDGALFFRSELSEPFAFESTPAVVAGALRPGAERMILFHIVARGACWIETVQGERHRATVGDVIVLPYGDQHIIRGSAPAEAVHILTLLEPPPWAHLPTIRHGGGGDPVELVCGYLFSDDPLFDPSLRALPQAFVSRPPDDATAGWVQASINYSLHESVPSDASGNPTSIRLPELVLKEVLRRHLTTSPATDHGWIAALSDPVLAPALALLHGEPARKWTVAELASSVAVSRSSLDERFRKVLDRSPIRYLTEWRMHLAEELLDADEVGVATIGRRVGYESEEAFSRAFKRAHGHSPTSWRAGRAALDVLD